MKHCLLLFLLVVVFFPTRSFGQLQDGSTAPDWTLTDIEGNTHHLYELLDQGKMVVIEFSATWCGPCWNYMLTGALEEFWEEHGPNGTDEAQVFYLESDRTTGMDDLLGLTPSSQGNWVEAIPFPLIDLQVGEYTDADYDINYYPTLYAVCSDRKVYELGQVGAYGWANFINSCALAADLANIEDAICYGDGAVTLDVTGGATPISYDWSNGDDEPMLSNVGAGTYSVTVTEGNGRNVVIDDIVIDGETAPIGLSYAEIESVLCFESSTGSITLALEEGNAPFSYEWSNGAQTQNISNVPAGLYTFNATDVNGCTFEESFTIDQPDELVATYETTPDYCDQEVGTIELDIDGGVGNYDISASQGLVLGNMIIQLPSGEVIATVEDGNGCIWEEEIEIEYVPEHVVYFTADPVLSCIQPTSTFSGYVQNGSGDYEYEWSTTNGNIVGPTNQESVTVDQEGEYSLLVYDIFSGCQVENAIEVETTVVLPMVEGGGDEPISCEDLQPELSGEGDPAYLVSWSTPDGNIVSGGDTYIPTVDQPGLYIIEVTNQDNSCSNVDSVFVIDNINPASSAFQYQTSGLTMVGTDVSTGSNLSGWLWNFGDGNTSTDPNPVHTFSAAGIYNVCLSVQNGCGTSNNCLQVEVTSSGSSISVIADITHVLCNADTTGGINLIVNGGSGNYTYAWTGPNGENYSDPILTNVPAGVYQLVVSDEQGNLFIGEFTVTEPTALVLVGSTVVDNLCYGEANGQVSVDITGGVGPFSYSFNGGPSQAENVITNLPAGAVESIVTDANGCSFVAGTYAIQEPSAVAYTSAISSVRCFGESNGAVSLSVSGGVAPYTYVWENGGQTTPDLSQLPAGQYVCQITDHNGCMNAASVLVTQPEILAATNIQVVNASSAEQNNGTISLEVIGGVAPYTVTWTNGAVGTVITGLTPGEYSYQIIDANGCVTGSASPVVVEGTVSTNTTDWEKYVTITPNPSKGDVIVNWKGMEAGNGTLTLVNLEGRRLQSRNILGGTGSWDLSGAGLTSGVYIVLLEMSGHAVPFKLVVF